MKYYDKIKELCKSEFEDYSFTEKYEIHYEDTNNDYEYYEIKFPPYNDHNLNRLTVKVSAGDIQVKLGEDNWEIIETFDWTIKYLWMALLTEF